MRDRGYWRGESAHAGFKEFDLDDERMKLGPLYDKDELRKLTSRSDRKIENFLF